MQLVINELGNSCRFTHLITRDVQLQSPIVLTIKIIIFIIMKFHVIINFNMMCKVHVISTSSFYSTKYYKNALMDG
jgi:hypothetical protein